MRPRILLYITYILKVIKYEENNSNERTGREREIFLAVSHFT